MELDGGHTKDISFHIKDNNLSFSHNKAKNLVTALFMVTDIMDKDETIKNKLRNSGLEIISDIYNTSYWTNIKIKDIITKVAFIITLIDIASDLKMISSMNSNILKKEFTLFLKSLEESIENISNEANQNLNDLFVHSEVKKSNLFEVTEAFPIGHNGQDNEYKIEQRKTNGQSSTNIGLQKGSTLLNALREIELSKTTQNSSQIKPKPIPKLKQKTNDKNIVNSDKSNRREEIVKIIKDSRGGLTITEIKVKARGELATMSDKTLQRELVALVDLRVLYKTGEKRWSRYFAKS